MRSWGVTSFLFIVFLLIAFFQGQVSHASGDPYDSGTHIEMDSDGDGLSDDVDTCPADPDPECGYAMPTSDLDGDGISDDVDPCPENSDPDCNEDNTGLPPLTDTDADGLPDAYDPCPNDPSNVCDISTGSDANIYECIISIATISDDCGNPDTDPEYCWDDALYSIDLGEAELKCHTYGDVNQAYNEMLGFGNPIDKLKGFYDGLASELFPGQGYDAKGADDTEDGGGRNAARHMIAYSKGGLLQIGMKFMEKGKKNKSKIDIHNNNLGAGINGDLKTRTIAVLTKIAAGAHQWQKEANPAIQPGTSDTKSRERAQYLLDNPDKLDAILMGKTEP